MGGICDIINLNYRYPEFELMISINLAKLLITIIQINDFHNSPQRPLVAVDI